MSWTPFTYPFNMTGSPAVSVPCGFDAKGLPVGLQLVGPRFADDLVLAVAAAYQQAASLHEHPADALTVDGSVVSQPERYRVPNPPAASGQIVASTALIRP